MSTQESRSPTFSQPSYFNRLPRGRYHCTLCDVTLHTRNALKHEKSDSHARRVRDDENVKAWWSDEPIAPAPAWEVPSPSCPWLEWGVIEEDPLHRVEKWRMKVCSVPPIELAHELGGFGAELLAGDRHPTSNSSLLHWANTVPMLDRQSDQRKQRMHDFLEAYHLVYIYFPPMRALPIAHCFHHTDNFTPIVSPPYHASVSHPPLRSVVILRYVAPGDSLFSPQRLLTEPCSQPRTHAAFIPVLTLTL
ncbi:hypothetical protein BOTBODRAFT_34098 [Botryobasidium botryosum FD-172 SS1]|uniref:Uncharacterized protein n=1 Tax=Botryobasidium botryosum (strain FD-172 SS1) TaxID=930990 RepID=A0A067MM52_BOTB1|nr:hypothetical protein BOTBODRAFT_34098 [Botryobasidium botryosum FD-172 SS1]